MSTELPLKLSDLLTDSHVPPTRGEDEYRKGPYVICTWPNREDFKCGCANRTEWNGWGCATRPVPLDPRVRVFLGELFHGAVMHVTCQLFLKPVVEVDIH